MKLRFILLFCFISFNIFAQGIDNLWLMGYQSWYGRPLGGTNLNFIEAVMDTSYQIRIMNFDATNGVICDKNGHLLFSSNGVFISNAYNDTMLNGAGLNPSAYTSVMDSDGLNIPQANLILPFPGDSNKYYLFHETIDDFYYTDASYYLYKTVIDMKLDSGKGSVIDKNAVFLNDTLVPGFITACKHANGRDWWLVCHQLNTNGYFKYLITPDTIQGPYMQNIGSTRGIYFGQMVFSPDGSKAAFYEPNNDLDLMDFDRCTGDFSNLIHVDINDSAGGGIAFSPDSKVLYVSSDRYVYQFDLTSANIAATQTTVAVYDGYATDSLFATDFVLALLAPDGKVYIACGNSTLAIHVINYPDSVGLGCNVCQHCIHLPSFNFLTIPNFPNYFLGAETGSACDTLSVVENLFVQGSKLEVYPNPVIDDEITFTYNVSSEKGIISIYNIEGQEIIKYSLPQWSSVQYLKLPKLSSGIYLARLTQGNATSNVKFIEK